MRGEMKPDFWSEGYDAALRGATYAENPHEGTEPAATAWAFGCSDGMKEWNRRALSELIKQLSGD